MRIFVRFLITSIILSCTSVLMSHSADCNCICRSRGGLNVCDNIEKLWKKVDPHHEKLMEWENYKPFVKRFSDRWEEEIKRIVDIKMEEFMARWNPLPKPENLVSNVGNDIENDAILSKSAEESNDLVHNLLAKVEMVENRTFEVEEELKSERRVRRHLEQEVNETRSSLNNLGVQLQNVTGPVDNMMSQVQMVIFSSLEDMNKTLYEDHLKKLYYKVEGVVYKNETEKLGERLGQVETELHDSDNSSIVSKLAEDLKAMEENLLSLNSSIEDTVKPRLEVLNSSIEDTVKPRLEVLNSSIEETLKPRLEVLNSSIEGTVKPRLQVLNSSIEDTLKPRLEVLNSSIEDTVKPRLEVLNTSIEDTVKPRLEVLNSSIEGTVKPRLEVLNSSIEDTVKPRLEVLNSSIEDTVKPLLEVLNNSIEGTVKPRLEVLSLVSDILVPRIETLENETVRKDVVEELSGKMADILNGTELFKTSLIDISLDIQDIKDFERKLQNLSTEWNKSLGTLQYQIDFLKNETEAMNKSQREPKIDDNIEIVQSKVTGISDDTMEEVTANESDYDYFTPDFTTFIANKSTVDANSIMEKKSSELVVTPSIIDRVTVSKNVEQPIEDYYSIDYIEEPDVTQTVEVDRPRIKGVSDKDDECSEKPDVNDSHLLVEVVQDSSGRNKLKFGCRPIGTHALSPLPVPPRCHMGSWKEPFPSCKKLPDKYEIETLADELLESHPCVIGSGEFPDPFNCSQFFKCSFMKLTVFPCPDGLHFDPQLKVCAYRRGDSCHVAKNSHEEELESLIPPIHIEPDVVDRPGSHLGTGSTGQLIVHPLSRFTLHCLYPENIWGYPKWYVDEDFSRGSRVSKEGSNRVSLTITAAGVEDSGVYKCVSPFGVQNSVEVVVKVVVCPAFMLGEEYEDVFYRPTPEGEQRIMGTTAEFLCEDGGRIVAYCNTDGKWSRGLPTDDECTLKKRISPWNCQPFDMSKHPDLIVERNDRQRILTFKCAGRKRLVGNSFTRCRNDGIWSHVSLPRCKG